MKWTKLIKAALTPEQISFAKMLIPNYSASDFEFAIDVKNEIQSELQYKFDDKSLEISEEDFKAITGFSMEEMDKQLESAHKNEIIEDFEEMKEDDLDVLRDILENLKLSFTQNKITQIINELEDLQHDGSSDLGYSKEHVLDQKHKRMV